MCTLCMGIVATFLKKKNSFSFPCSVYFYTVSENLSIFDKFIYFLCKFLLNVLSTIFAQMLSMDLYIHFNSYPTIP